MEGTVQMFKRLLQALGIGFRKELHFGAPLPDRKPKRHLLIPEQRLPVLQPSQVHLKDLVPQETGHPCMRRKDPHQNRVVLKPEHIPFAYHHTMYIPLLYYMPKRQLTLRLISPP